MSIDDVNEKVRALEQQVSRSRDVEEILQRKTHELVERIKEMDCLYAMSGLLMRENVSVESIIKNTAELIPDAWQYPDITCARIRFREHSVETDEFEETEWSQSCEIDMGEDGGLRIDVFYKEKKPAADEGPFLKEERKLLNAVGELLAQILKKNRYQEWLKESEELHRVTLGNISDAVFLTDEDGFFTFICPNVDVIFGYSASEVEAAANISALLGEDFYDRAELDRVTEIPNIELEITDKSGVAHSLLVNVKKVSIKSGKILYTCRDITERKKTEKALLESEKQLRALSRKVLTAQEEEREKVSRELHDELGHQLAALRLELDWLKKNAGPEEMRGGMDKAMEMVLSATTGLRALCKGLRPMITDYTGLGLAIETMTREFGQRGGFNVNFEVSGFEGLEIDRDAAICIYRVLQEALTNVVRHSEAGNVSVAFKLRDGALLLEVFDDGRGMSEEMMTGNHGIGIIGMRERASLCGGEALVESSMGEGVKVRLRIPVRGVGK